MSKITLFSTLQCRGFRIWLKACAILVSVSFTFPYLTWAFDAANYALPQTQLSRIAHLGKVLSIPEKMGTIGLGFQGDQKTMVCIQDLHCNYEVQKNIAGIIHHLAKKHGLKLVGEEGAFDTVNTNRLSAFPIQQVRDEVTDYFVKQGRITGAEYYAITGKHSIRLEGIETPALYEASQQAVRSFLNHESQGYCYDLRETLDEMKETIYNPRLRKFDAKRMAWREGDLDILKYSGYVRAAARRLKLDLSAYPNLERFLSLKQSFFSVGVDPDRLFQELDKLDAGIRSQLYSSDVQRELDELYTRLDIIEKLLNISAAPEELQEFRAQRGQFSTREFIQFIGRGDSRIAPLLDMEIHVLDEYLRQVETFYRLADERSIKFVDNLVQKMDHYGENLAVMINGGFHAEKVLAELKRRNITCVSIKPRITRHDVVNPYFSLLQGRKTPLEKLLEKNQTIMAIKTAVNNKVFVKKLELVEASMAGAMTLNLKELKALEAHMEIYGFDEVIRISEKKAAEAGLLNMEGVTVLSTSLEKSGEKVVILVAPEGTISNKLGTTAFETINIGDKTIRFYYSLDNAAKDSRLMSESETTSFLIHAINTVFAVIEYLIDAPSFIARLIGFPQLEAEWKARHRTAPKHMDVFETFSDKLYTGTITGLTAGLVLGIALVAASYLGVPIASELNIENTWNILVVILGSSLGVGFMSYVSWHVPYNLRHPDAPRSMFNIVRAIFSSKRQREKVHKRVGTPTGPAVSSAGKGTTSEKIIRDHLEEMQRSGKISNAIFDLDYYWRRVFFRAGYPELYDEARCQRVIAPSKRIYDNGGGLTGAKFAQLGLEALDQSEQTPTGPAASSSAAAQGPTSSEAAQKLIEEIDEFISILEKVKQRGRGWDDLSINQVNAFLKSSIFTYTVDDPSGIGRFTEISPLIRPWADKMGSLQGEAFIMFSEAFDPLVLRREFDFSPYKNSDENYTYVEANIALLIELKARIKKKAGGVPETPDEGLPVTDASSDQKSAPVKYHPADNFEAGIRMSIEDLTAKHEKVVSEIADRIKAVNGERRSELNKSLAEDKFLTEHITLIEAKLEELLGSWSALDDEERRANKQKIRDQIEHGTRILHDKEEHYLQEIIRAIENEITNGIAALRAQAAEDFSEIEERIKAVKGGRKGELKETLKINNKDLSNLCKNGEAYVKKVSASWSNESTLDDLKETQTEIERTRKIFENGKNQYIINIRWILEEIDKSLATSTDDFYEILGVDKDTDLAGIKKAYRTLAMEFHPDRNPDNSEAEARFKEISVAYAVLSTPKKEYYDEYGVAPAAGYAAGKSELLKTWSLKFMSNKHISKWFPWFTEKWYDKNVVLMETLWAVGFAVAGLTILGLLSLAGVEPAIAQQLLPMDTFTAILQSTLKAVLVFFPIVHLDKVFSWLGLDKLFPSLRTTTKTPLENAAAAAFISLVTGLLWLSLPASLPAFTSIFIVLMLFFPITHGITNWITNKISPSIPAADGSINQENVNFLRNALGISNPGDEGTFYEFLVMKPEDLTKRPTVNKILAIKAYQAGKKARLQGNTATYNRNLSTVIKWLQIADLEELDAGCFTRCLFMKRDNLETVKSIELLYREAANIYAALYPNKQKEIKMPTSKEIRSELSRQKEARYKSGNGHYIAWMLEDFSWNKKTIKQRFKLFIEKHPRILLKDSRTNLDLLKTAWFFKMIESGIKESRIEEVMGISEKRALRGISTRVKKYQPPSVVESKSSFLSRVLRFGVSGALLASVWPFSALGSGDETTSERTMQWDASEGKQVIFNKHGQPVEVRPESKETTGEDMDMLPLNEIPVFTPKEKMNVLWYLDQTAGKIDIKRQLLIAENNSTDLIENLQDKTFRANLKKHIIPCLSKLDKKVQIYVINNLKLYDWSNSNIEVLSGRIIPGIKAENGKIVLPEEWTGAVGEDTNENDFLTQAAAKEEMYSVIIKDITGKYVSEDMETNILKIKADELIVRSYVPLLSGEKDVTPEEFSGEEGKKALKIFQEGLMEFGLLDNTTLGEEGVWNKQTQEALAEFQRIMEIEGGKNGEVITASTLSAWRYMLLISHVNYDRGIAIDNWKLQQGITGDEKRRVYPPFEITKFFVHNHIDSVREDKSGLITIPYEVGAKDTAEINWYIPHGTHNYGRSACVRLDGITGKLIGEDPSQIELMLSEHRRSSDNRRYTKQLLSFGPSWEHLEIGQISYLRSLRMWIKITNRKEVPIKGALFVKPVFYEAYSNNSISNGLETMKRLVDVDKELTYLTKMKIIDEIVHSKSWRLREPSSGSKIMDEAKSGLKFLQKLPALLGRSISGPDEVIINGLRVPQVTIRDGVKKIDFGGDTFVIIDLAEAEIRPITALGNGRAAMNASEMIDSGAIGVISGAPFRWDYNFWGVRINGENVGTEGNYPALLVVTKDGEVDIGERGKMIEEYGDGNIVHCMGSYSTIVTNGEVDLSSINPDDVDLGSNEKVWNSAVGIIRGADGNAERIVFISNRDNLYWGAHSKTIVKSLAECLIAVGCSDAMTLKGVRSVIGVNGDSSVTTDSEYSFPTAIGAFPAGKSELLRTWTNWLFPEELADETYDKYAFLIESVWALSFATFGLAIVLVVAPTVLSLLGINPAIAQQLLPMDASAAYLLQIILGAALIFLPILHLDKVFSWLRLDKVFSWLKLDRFLPSFLRPETKKTPLKNVVAAVFISVVTLILWLAMPIFIPALTSLQIVIIALAAFPIIHGMINKISDLFTKFDWEGLYHVFFPKIEYESEEIKTTPFAEFLGEKAGVVNEEIYAKNVFGKVVRMFKDNLFGEEFMLKNINVRVGQSFGAGFEEKPLENNEKKLDLSQAFFDERVIFVISMPKWAGKIVQSRSKSLEVKIVKYVLSRRLYVSLFWVLLKRKASILWVDLGLDRRGEIVKYIMENLDRTTRPIEATERPKADEKLTIGQDVFLQICAKKLGIKIANEDELKKKLSFNLLSHKEQNEIRHADKDARKRAAEDYPFWFKNHDVANMVSAAESLGEDTMAGMMMEDMKNADEKTRVMLEHALAAAVIRGDIIDFLQDIDMEKLETISLVACPELAKKLLEQIDKDQEANQALIKILEAMESKKAGEVITISIVEVRSLIEEHETQAGAGEQATSSVEIGKTYQGEYVYAIADTREVEKFEVFNENEELIATFYLPTVGQITSEKEQLQDSDIEEIVTKQPVHRFTGRIPAGEDIDKKAELKSTDKVVLRFGVTYIHRSIGRKNPDAYFNERILKPMENMQHSKNSPFCREMARTGSDLQKLTKAVIAAPDKQTRFRAQEELNCAALAWITNYFEIFGDGNSDILKENILNIEAFTRFSELMNPFMKVERNYAHPNGEFKKFADEHEIEQNDVSIPYISRGSYHGLRGAYADMLAKLGYEVDENKETRFIRKAIRFGGAA